MVKKLISITFLLYTLTLIVPNPIYTQEIPTPVESQLGSWYEGEGLSKAEEGNILKVRVEGYQWWWAFDYPQLGITTANEMVMPAGKVVHLELRSKDVIHSFWLPRIAGKVDGEARRATY